MSKEQRIYNRMVTVSDPLPDPFGYDYGEAPSLEEVRRILNSTLVEEIERKSTPKARLILREYKEPVNESFMSKLKLAAALWVIDLVRGALLSKFDVDIDKDSFHSFDAEGVDTRSPEFKDPNKVYLSSLKKDNESSLVLIHRGKIVGVYGGKNLVKRDKDTAGSVLKKAVATWWAKSQKNESLSFNKAQKLLMNI